MEEIGHVALNLLEEARTLPKQRTISAACGTGLP